MKLMFFFAALIILVGVKQRINNQRPREVLKCYGYRPCSACTTCNYCVYCNSGGTCGICAWKKAKIDTIQTNSKSHTQQVPVSSQCRAITKKGTRCSRAARSNGYCWQHGG